MNTYRLKEQVNKLFRNNEYDRVKSCLLSHKDITEHDNDLAIVCYLCTIYENEKDAGQITLFSKVSCIEELLERYTVLKFYLRRIDFDVMERGDITRFYRFLVQNQVTAFEMMGVIEFSIVHKEKVLQAVKNCLAFGLQADDMDDANNRKYSYECTNTIEMKDNEENGKNRSEKEICFVICTNNQIYAQECIYYINHLNLVDGFIIDVLTVEGAKSLAAAYNEAMQCSRAKYKVYLHHDTFIINPNFIMECLNIFKNDPRIGLIGNVGCKTMPATGVMWDADRYGMLYEQHIYETSLLANAIEPELEYMEVDAIDGFIMVTQYDIPWREDLFDKWDFYDCSQSMEFRRKGYKVVIPNMKHPWCVHDCGFINLQNFDEEREKFVIEYLVDQDE